MCRECLKTYRYVSRYKSIERWLLSLGEVLGFCIQYHGFVIDIANTIASTAYIRSRDTEVPEWVAIFYKGCV